MFPPVPDVSVFHNRQREVLTGRKSLCPSVLSSPTITNCCRCEQHKVRSLRVAASRFEFGRTTQPNLATRREGQDSKTSYTSFKLILHLNPKTSVLRLLYLLKGSRPKMLIEEE